MKRLEDRKIHVRLTEAAKDDLVEEGFDASYGARPLKRALQRRVLDPLALQVLEGHFGEGDTCSWTSGRTGWRSRSAKWSAPEEISRRRAPGPTEPLPRRLQRRLVRGVGTEGRFGRGESHAAVRTVAEGFLRGVAAAAEGEGALGERRGCRSSRW
jgi:hypothetical protein